MYSTHSHLVLILTYWNVNYSSSINFNASSLVLILTYWNVNVVQIVRQGHTAGFNLNLLECKLRESLTEQHSRLSFNLNLLECK